MNEKISQTEEAWYSEVSQVKKEIAECRKTRNYYEGMRKKLQVRLDFLIKMDPRQMKLELRDGE